MYNGMCSEEIKLMTTLVDIWNGPIKKTIRAFIDPGSQSSYVLNSTAAEVGFESIGEERAVHSLLGGRRTKVITHNHFELGIQRHGGGFKCRLEARGIEKICNPIPRIRRTSELFSQLKKNKIYVSDIDNGAKAVPEIELLIGGDYFGQIISGKTVKLEYGVTAVETEFGWVLSGGKKMNAQEDTATRMVMSMCALDSPIENLWELETLGIKDDTEAKSADKREQEIKEQFMSTISRNNEGRYVVRLPFLEDHPPLPTNKNVAIKRLENATRKMAEMDKFEVYDVLLKSWENEFTERVSIEGEIGAHYIPHRPVFKDSLTTPVRPVFDCSCKVGQAPSLNDCLHKGSNCIQLIPELIMRFREKSVGVTSDIKKAFQMIEVAEEHRKFLRFLWWESLQRKTLIELQHVRVVFGATCSPFMLGAVLEYHLTHVPIEYKEVANKLLTGFYVDNYVASEDNENEYFRFRDKAVKILADAKMDLRMWLSNVEDLDDPVTQITPVLGIQWNRKSDHLFIPINGIQKPEILTKRTLLSVIQKIFDPCGFLSPVLIPMKRILQLQWINNRKWDEILPQEEERTFGQWYSQLSVLKEIEIPRLATNGVTDRSKWSLHTFSDGSSYAFACVTYLRVESQNGVSVQLLMSKARIAPKKPMTIPRMELMGCLIASRLTATVKKALGVTDVPEYYWSDSSTALAWIKRDYNF